MNGARRVSATGFQEVFKGPAATIRLSPGAFAEYKTLLEGKDELSVKRRVHLLRYFKEFCECRTQKLSKEKFRKEADYPDGRGQKVAVWAFKAPKWRLYGAILAVGGETCFVGVRVDPAKKRDRADAGIMRRAAVDIGTLAEY